MSGPKNGIYAVMETAHGFSVPVHVQRLTLAQQHISHCEMEDCHHYHLLAKQSGVFHSLCEHIRSVDYCVATGREEKLQHQVLVEMMENKFFGQSKYLVNDPQALAREKAEKLQATMGEVISTLNIDARKLRAVDRRNSLLLNQLQQVQQQYANLLSQHNAHHPPDIPDADLLEISMEEIPGETPEEAPEVSPGASSRVSPRNEKKSLSQE
ncbi:uncharacterized protein V6R79_004407 [Siganus canaliculatus]